MNNIASFTVCYSGAALQEHSMDVRDLSPALLSIGQLFDEANRVLNGEKVLRPLSTEGIDNFTIKDKEQQIEQLDKSDYPYFKTPEIVDEKIIEIEHEAAYTIISLTFKEENKWRLHDGNSTVTAVIKDDEFLRQVNENLISFAKGDILLCKVKTVQWKTDIGLRTEYTVLKVKQHNSAARQIPLFDVDVIETTADGA